MSQMLLRDALVERYAVDRELGRGGMATVFLAQDLKHQRPVAIKLLDPELGRAIGPERFLREIEIAATLQHAHIVPLYDSGAADGLLYYVMPYVDGETLRERLNREKQLSLEETLKIAAEVAGALTYAHGRGVVHRDIKPENIMLSGGSTVVADFGIARAISAAGEKSLTQTGTVIGTPQYMSPEQAVGGAEIGGRSDQYSLACVVYEMLVGEPPFTGLTPQAVMARQSLGAVSPPSIFRTTIPDAVEEAILRALAKVPADRFATVALFAEALTAPAAVTGARGRTTSTGPSPPVISRRRSVITRGRTVLVIVATVVVAATLLLLRRPAVAPATEYEQLTNFDGTVGAPALSRDGRLLAFTAEGPEGEDSQVYVKLLPKGDPVRLTRDSLRKNLPAFSPDGSRIAYQAGGDVWVVPTLGGEPQILLRHAQTSLHWVDDQRVVFSAFKSGIHLALVTGTEDGAQLRDVYLPPTEAGMVHASWPSPDGKWVLLTEMVARGLGGAPGNLPCRVVPLNGRSTGVQVGPPGAPCNGGAWSPDSRWIYVSARTSSGLHLWRQRFPDGSPEQVTFGATSEWSVVVAPDGSLIAEVGAYQTTIGLRGAGSERRFIAEVNAASPSFTPDGKALLYLARGPASRTGERDELWRVDIESGVRTRLLPGVLTSHYSLSRDGKEIVFTVFDARGVSGIWRAPADRNSAPRQLTSSDERRPFFGAHGDIIFDGSEGAARFLFRMRDDGSERKKIRSDSIRYLANVSPDGEWAAVWVVGADEKKTPAVLAVPVSGGATLLVCQVCGGSTAQAAPAVSWTPDQKYLFLSQRFSEMDTKTFVVPLSRGRAFPDLPPTGIVAERDVLRLPGVSTIPEGNVFPGPSPAVYAFFRVTSQSNLYRIKLPPPE